MGMRRSTLIVFLLILALTMVFIYGMIGWNILISFTGWKGGIPSYNFVGLSNYTSLIHDPLFWGSFLRTLLLFSVIPISLGIGLFLAILLNQNVKGARIFMVIYLMPFAFSLVVTGVVWGKMFAPSNGAVNNLLRAIGFGGLASGWYTQPSTVMLSVIIATVWQFSGYCMLILLAGLRSVSRKKIADARAKGASSFKIFKELVLPRLAIPILTSVVVLMIFTLKTFDLIWVMTSHGGPGTSAYTLPVMVVVKANYELAVAYGAAAGNVLVALVLLIIIPYLYWIYRKR
jgi:glucose/mannose transport system permease protein